MVARHADGRAGLLAPASSAFVDHNAIVGMDPEIANALVCELQRHLTQPAFTHLHQWEAGDTAIWHNRKTAHATTHYDPSVGGPRVMWRTTVKALAATAAATVDARL